MMLAHDVLEIVARLDAAGVRVWLDGGWGVDALIRHQTRDHEDLDLVPLPAANAARRTLTVLGFRLTEDEATLCFVARDAPDRRVDDTFWRYPPEGFSGFGLVEGRGVAYLSAEVQVLYHLNYDPDRTDRRGMKLLAQSRGISLPDPYGP